MAAAVDTVNLSFRDVILATSDDAACRQWLRANCLLAGTMHCNKCNAVMNEVADQSQRRSYLALSKQEMSGDNKHTKRELLREIAYPLDYNCRPHLHVVHESNVKRDG